MRKILKSASGKTLLALIGFCGCINQEKPTNITAPAYQRTMEKAHEIRVEYKDEDDRKFMTDRIRTWLRLEISIAEGLCDEYHSKYGIDRDLEEFVTTILDIYKTVKQDPQRAVRFYEKLRTWGMKPMEVSERIKAEEKKRKEEQERKMRPG